MVNPVQRVAVGAGATGTLSSVPSTPVETSTFQKVSNGINGFKDAILAKFLNIGRMVTHSENGGVAIQKIAKVALAILFALERLIMGTEYYVKNALGITDNYVDGIQVIGDINSIAKGTFKTLWNDGICPFVGVLALTLSNIGSAMLLAESPLKMVKWANVAASLGKLRLFSVHVFAILNKMSLEVFVRANVVIGLVLLSINTVSKMIKGEDLTSSKLMLAHAIPEVLLQLALIAGMVGIAVHALRLTAAFADVIKLYHEVNKQPIKA